MGHTRLTHGYLMTRNDQQPTCTNVSSRNQTLIIKYYLMECLQWSDPIKKYNIQSDIKTLLGKDCEVEKIMRYCWHVSASKCLKGGIVY